MDGKSIVIVLDGLGVGELPDATDYGDSGTNTMLSISKSKKLEIPNLLSFGLGKLTSLDSVLFEGEIKASFGKMAEKSCGKDRTTGHWEIAGLVIEKPFPVFSFFPEDIIKEFVSLSGIKGVLGNLAASGTEIINSLGDEHYKTGKPIVYTSADSVFQIAASEEVIALEELYRLCNVARDKVFIEDFAVARVIARPFIKKEGKYVRTSNRKDFSLKPFSNTMLNILQLNGIKTIGIGKINDLFAGYGLDVKIHTKSNTETIYKTIEEISSSGKIFIFSNLVDFDMLFGHRNDGLGFANALEYFDSELPNIMEAMNEDDILIITADHGNDPGDISTDHTREYVPLLVYSKNKNGNVNLGIRNSFSDIAKTVLDFYNVGNSLHGESFLQSLN
jgi:phosphopentomutase